MSNLDLVQQETISLKVDQIHKNLPDSNEEPLDQIDNDLLQAWREAFEEDKVQVLEVCC